MSDDLYKLIPEEGKHLAESRDTEGAYRGVYLDDETNKPNGAGEFVKVDPNELFDQYNEPDSDNTSDSSDGSGVVAIVALAAFAAGLGVAKAVPHIKKFVGDKITPSIKRGINKITKHTNSQEKLQLDTLPVPEMSISQTPAYTTSGIVTAYDKYRENMSSEAAQRELIEAFILYLQSMKKLNRVVNANIIDSDGSVTDGKTFLCEMPNNGMLESVNEILKNNPQLLDRQQQQSLFEILGFIPYGEQEYIPISTDVLKKLVETKVSEQILD